MAVGQKHVPKMGPGKWKHGPNPAAQFLVVSFDPYVDSFRSCEKDTALSFDKPCCGPHPVARRDRKNPVPGNKEAQLFMARIQGEASSTALGSQCAVSPADKGC